jgi:hypothetical protein
MKVKQALVSGGVFCVLLFALMSIDPHVRDRFFDLVIGGGVSSFGDRASMLGDALVSAVKYQSLENAPMVVFATAGAALVLFMVRT